MQIIDVSGSMELNKMEYKYMKNFGNAAAALFAALFVVGMPVVSFAETAVNLGTAANFVILTETGITNTGATKIVGNLGVSPIASTAITGFGLVLVKPGRYSRSSLVDGGIYAANYASPTPSYLTREVGDMRTAYTNAAARKNPTAINLGSGNIGGRVIKPGLYKWTSAVTIPKDVTLWGDKNAVWVFQIAGTLNISSGKRVVLVGGALPANIYWQVAGATTLETTAAFNGNILDKTGISFKTGAKLNGRALAQTAVTLEDNAVTVPPRPAPATAVAVGYPNGSPCPAAACSSLSP